MNRSPSKIADRIKSLVAERNRGFALDAALKFGLGLVFTAVTFGFLFWLGWFLGVLFGSFLDFSAVKFGAIFSGVFFVVAVGSAWWRVEPFKGLQPLSDGETLAILLAQASGATVVSPRHATAGVATILIGGPQSIFESFGVFAHRLRNDAETIEDAAMLLQECRTQCRLRDVRTPAAAVLLKRLDLVKVRTSDGQEVLVLTEKGRGVAK